MIAFLILQHLFYNNYYYAVYHDTILSLYKPNIYLCSILKSEVITRFMKKQISQFCIFSNTEAQYPVAKMSRKLNAVILFAVKEIH